MATASTTTTLAPRLDELPRLMGWVEAEIGGLTSCVSVKLKALLVLEELFLNTVHHTSAENDVLVSIACNNHELLIGYEDSGEPYDPEHISANADARTKDPLAERPIGGLGVLLVYQLPSHTVYSHLEGRNRFALTFILDEQT